MVQHISPGQVVPQLTERPLGYADSAEQRKGNVAFIGYSDNEIEVCLVIFPAFDRYSVIGSKFFVKDANIGNIKILAAYVFQLYLLWHGNQQSRPGIFLL